MSNNSLVWHKELRAGRHEDLHLQVGSLEQPCAAERAAGGMAGPCANKHILQGPQRGIHRGHLPKPTESQCFYSRQTLI